MARLHHSSPATVLGAGIIMCAVAMLLAIPVLKAGPGLPRCVVAHHPTAGASADHHHAHAAADEHAGHPGEHRHAKADTPDCCAPGCGLAVLCREPPAAIIAARPQRHVAAMRTGAEGVVPDAPLKPPKPVSIVDDPAA